MTSIQTADKNYVKMIQIYQVLEHKSDLERDTAMLYIKKVIENDFDINYKLKSNSRICEKMPEYAGNTVLHFAVEFCRSSVINKYKEYDPSVDFFIEQGSDITIKNNNGYTPLLLAFKKNLVSTKIDCLLSAHLKKNYFTNVHCKHGMSHFHVACTTNNVKAVDSFLKAGISVNERVNDDSPKYPGYTPLHFAAECGLIETMKLLLSNGANINSKDAKGWTPLHLLIEKHKELVFDQTLSPALSYSTSLPDDVGLTYLHISCISDNVELVKNLIKKGAKINSSIKFDSPLWPGYTPLRVALDQDKLSTAMLLLEKGANLLAKDARGKSPFDLCTEKYSLDKIIQILSTVKRYQTFKIKFTDGTCLLQVLYAFEDLKKFDKFVKTKGKNINIYLPFDSPIWPGSNLFHLSVIFSKWMYFKKLLSFNLEFMILNGDGTSPLHLAFHLKRKEMIQMILNCYEQLSSSSINRNNNMSILHIACAVKHRPAIEFLLRNGSNPNLPLLNDVIGDEDLIMKSNVIRAGSTPFHIALKTFERFNSKNLLDIIDLLLSFGANFNSADVDGVTPFQIILEYYDHVQSSRFDRVLKPEMKVMLCHIFSSNAAVQMTRAVSLTILRSNLLMLNSTALFEKLISEFVGEKQYEKLGLTKLHVACAIHDLSLVREELESGADVNRSISLDSDIWPGDTALHILFRGDSWFKYKIAKLLLEHGADITLKNASNLTPVHLSKEKDLEIGISLLRNKFTNVNPVNNEGLSHFHLSCMTNNELVVEEFLKSGFDVNAPVDYFANCDAGYTPLHFAVKHDCNEIIELLISHGADPLIMDADGQTPFHLIASSKKFHQDRVENLLRCPAIDFEAMNRFGEAVFERAIKNCTMSDYDFMPKSRFINETINLILKKAIPISFEKFTAENLYGLKLVVSTACYCSNETFQRLINSIPDLSNVNDKGQNALHCVLNTKFKNYFSIRSICMDCMWNIENSMLNNYHKNINVLAKTIGEINHKDNQGKTALSIAASLDRHIHGPVRVLLSLGADINIEDDEGRVPFTYLSNNSIYGFDTANRYFLNHIEKLKLFGFFVDPTNNITDDSRHHSFKFPIDEIKNEKSQLDAKFKQGIVLSITADYFYSERFVLNYRRMTATQRQAIINICDSDNLERQFRNTYDLINLQFGKARARTRLIEPAMAALQSFTNLNIPYLCLDFIIDYLDNNDLMNLVRAHNGKLIFAPLPENC